MRFGPASSLEAAQARRLRASGRPVQQLHRVRDRNGEAGADLGHAADVARRDDVGLERFEVRSLARPEAAGDLRLQ
jgi:hypothetical protein